MPGTPVLRYGEEIGMGEDLTLPGRDAIAHADAVGRRTATAAFDHRRSGRAGTPGRRRGGQYGYRAVNVRAQAT